MVESDAEVRCKRRFAQCFDAAPALVGSAPGRLEVLGNHTDYNLGLTLSCAVGQRCYAAIAPLQRPEVELASTSIDRGPAVYKLDDLSAPAGDWANYVLGLVAMLVERGCDVPGFAMLIDSDVPRSAGLSSSAALQMASLTAIVGMTGLELPPLELARIGQRVESEIVGARTGLLDPLSSLLGRRDHLLEIDYLTNQTRRHAMPPGWCFVAVDSGVQHDLTKEYNQRRASCEQAAAAMGVASLREADLASLDTHRASMDEDAGRCARHVIEEIQRVTTAGEALANGDVEALGSCMFASHLSSRDHFRNSCEALDTLVQFGENDPRCIGARLSGGGFGGMTIHLVQTSDAQAYLESLLDWCEGKTGARPWGAVCAIDDGARLNELSG